MRSIRAMLATFAYVCMVVVLPSPASSQKEVLNAQRILSKVSKLGFNNNRPLVHGCGPEVVGEECESLVAKTISGSAHKQTHPCPTRHGDFPVPKNHQKFYRCHGNIFTIEDCGKLYFFDPDLRYCVLKKKEKSTPATPKNGKTRQTPKNPKTKPTPPTTTTTPAPPVSCPRGLSSPLLGNVTADHDMVQACKDQNCGSELIRLNRLRQAQCKMNRSSPVRVITRKAKNINQWNVSISSEYIREARFWWVADIPLQLVWRSPGYVTTLQDCLTDCNDRFVIAGPTTCACGSISEEHPDFNVEHWVRTQHSKKLNEEEGFLLYDKDALMTGGWSCTSEPVGWKKYPAKIFSQCISVCKGAKEDFVAFGKGGCRCGNAADAGKGFRSLPMVHCQKRLAGVDAYSVLSVGYWTDLYSSYRNSSKLSVLWANKRPKDVIWRREAGRPEARSCLQACHDKGDARWISIGVTGCECGVSGTHVGNLEWSLKYEKKFHGQYSPARGFFLVKIKGNLQGFRPKSFDYTQTFTVPHGNDKYLDIDAIPHPTSDKIVSSMSMMVEERHSHIDYYRVRAAVVPNNAPNYLSQHTEDGASSYERATKKHLSTLIGKYHRRADRAFGYFGYEKLPFFRKEDVKEQTVYRVSELSAYLSSLISNATELRKRFGFRKTIRKLSGQMFYIKPAIFGDCFTGVANETGWNNLGTRPGTLRKCICACKTTKYRVAAAILQSGRCFCSASSEQLGNLIASVPKPASCPKGTSREAYTVTKQLFLRRTHQFCEDFKENPELRVIGPGMTGKYIETARSYFEHTSTRGTAVSVDRLKATEDERMVKSTGNFTVELHSKKGKEQFLSGSNLKKGLFPRTFSLRFAVKKLYAWHEHHAVYSGYERQEEKYKKVSHVKKKSANGNKTKAD